jgi:hypothetical protein
VRVQGVTGRAAIACLVAAVVALVALSAAGNVRAGLAAGIGLGLGSFNGLLADRALAAGFSPRVSSLPRLGILTLLAIGAGLLIGLDYAWLVILGLGAAQLLLVGIAARSLLNR